MSLHRQRGFTLIEIIAAFAILALGLGITMGIASGALGQAKRGATFTQAALHARTLLDTAGIVEPLGEGITEGEFEGGYRWRLEVVPYEVAADASAPTAAGMPAIELFQLVLTVSWDQGSEERSARFSTLRALMPGLQR